MNTQSTILFLELGCLDNGHPAVRRIDASQTGSSRTAPDSTFVSCGEAFAKIIAPYADDIEIVITDWTAVHVPLADFRRQLPKYVAARVVDSIYLEELTNSSWSDYHSALATRYACIQLWLSRRRPDCTQDWLALDLGCQLDDWPKDERKHLVCGSFSDTNVQHQLAQKLGEREKS
jgi:hypothetical protein